ncbi:T9SS type A sorting domain-containing protein [Pedobacter alpinus]|uniref:T9SS type A sorting domain-containing protein n=1 Tax=Pedobacter alpinus TaxID=1590643 RepID=A0ABW5TLY7_9SPHI
MKKALLLFTLIFFSATLLAQVPTITSFSPLNGKPGDVVTITGTNFNTTTTNNVVFFGATRATVTAATATSLSVTVPIGATYAPITLLNTTNNLAAQSLSNFNPIFSPAKPGITTADFTTNEVSDLGSNLVEFVASIAIGDLDGDGKSDLAFVGDGFIAVSRNTSTPTSSSFAPLVYFNILNPISLAITDLDGDGKLDLAVTNITSTVNVSVFRNTATSGILNANSFAAPVDFVLNNNTPRAVVSGDLDGDGKPDLVVVSESTFQSSFSILRNTSTAGSFTSSSFAPVVFVSTTVPSLSATIGDVDGDGKLDLITANNANSNVSVYRNTSTNGNITFAAPVNFGTGQTPQQIVIGDLDGDGKLDLVTVNNASENITVLANISTIGNVSFAIGVNYTTLSRPETVAIADFDGDTKPDLVVGNRDFRSSVFRNNSTVGSINFANKVDFSMTTRLNSTVAGDLNGDAKPDYVSVGSLNLYSQILVSSNVSSPPAITNVSSTIANGSYVVGAQIPISITFNEPVNVTGTPQLTLETGAIDRVGNYVSGTGTNTLTFNYTVQTGDVSTDLDYVSTTSLALNGGTIASVSSTLNATLTLPAPGAVGSLGANKDIVIPSTLPVTLINYTAKLNTNGIVQLNWLTESEINNSYFEILRSTDGKNFNTIVKVFGAGNSTQQTQYNYTDPTPISGTNYYQLIQYDKDGKQTDLGIRGVDVSFSLKELSVYPNPASSLVNLSFDAEVYQKVEIIDLTGKMLVNETINKQESNISLDISKLATGVYNIKLTGQKKVITKQIVKQ